MKKKILMSSIAVIALCLCLIAGSTYALFTTQTEVNIAVTAGQLGVKAMVVKDSEQLRSLQDPDGNFYDIDTFANGGSAKLRDGKLEIKRMTPGDAVRFQVTVENTGDVAVKYAVNWTINEDTYVDANGVAHPWEDVLKITVLDSQYNEFSSDTYNALGAPKATSTFYVIVEFANNTAEHDNHYQGRSVDIQFVVEAVQENGVDANGDLITH
jgi:hypothetical protein